MSRASVRTWGTSYRSLIGLLILRIVFLDNPPQLVHFQQTSSTCACGNFQQTVHKAGTVSMGTTAAGSRKLE